MVKTLDQISERVLRKLGRLPLGQVMDADQAQQVKDAYAELYAELLNDGIMEWVETDDIPDYAVSSIISMLLANLADDFGVPNQWASNYEYFRIKLASQIASPYVYQPTPFEEL
ncbi:MAG: hypothetical protein GY800_09025 [Planctomycetes bacterium]|nr:hypothetical protein [Planctomycetota bacterium]